jgi:hypothetical protein
MAEDNSWVKGAAWAVGLGVPLFVAGLATYIAVVAANAQRDQDRLTDQLTILTGQVSGLISTVAGLSQYKETHREEAKLWIGKIDDNTKAINQLLTNAHARPGAYTDKDAAKDKFELQSYINDLDARVTNIEACCINKSKQR